MISRKKTKYGATKLTLAGEMTIYECTDLKEKLEALMDESNAIEIDLAGVTELDTSCMQLLMQAKRAASEAKIDFRMLDHSEAAKDSLEMCGLENYFGDPIVISASLGAEKDNDDEYLR